MTPIRLPRASVDSDALDTLTAFHEAVFDVTAWVPTIVDADGRGSPRDARWLRAFLHGPLSWHLDDDESILSSWLHTRGSAWLDACLTRGRDQVARLRQAAAELASQVEPLAAGDAVPSARFQQAASRFAAAVEAAIRTEEDVVLPTARLLLDAQERKALTRALMSANETRPWLDAAFAGDAPVLHKIYAVRTRRADGSDVVRSFARCPRQRAIDVGTCANCAHQEALVVHGDGRGHVACAIDDRRPPTHRRVADVMTRDVFCVEQDTPLQDAVEMLAGARVTGVPVVDGEGRAVGVLSQSDVISAMAAGALTPGARVRDLMMHMAIVARENDPLDDAARLLVLEGIHRLPVINAEGFVVGIVSALDVLRGSSAIAQRPVLDRTSTPSG